MGLCKCPKRKVTNLFCFEHRVNVCEHCIVKKHPKCVVQSYLAWLQDSDYNPNCPLCDQDLNQGQCVRLVCYHLFHWSCLDRAMRSLPMDTTAPAGYSCPTCQECIFPPDNLVSPVADELRSILKEVNWARAGLGMPLLPKQEEAIVAPIHDAHISSTPPPPAGPRPAPEGQSVKTSALQDSSNSMNSIRSTSGDFVTEVPADSTTSRKALQAALPTSPLLLATKASNDSFYEDHDENKYKRRSALRFLVRWWRTFNSGRGVNFKRMSKGHRMLMVGGASLLAFITLMVILSHLSDRSNQNDPMLDPMNNPNIRVDTGI